MKIKINSITGDKDLFVEGELLQTIEDLRQGKINIKHIININKSWLYDTETKTIDNPKCFVIDYNCDDCDVEITLFDYWIE